MEKAEFIWMNGEFVKWEDAQIHVLTHALHYGSAVFEGVRAYETDRGPAIFRHAEHLERLERSGKLFHIDIPYEIDALRHATHELILRNNLDSCYIRPLVFRGYGEMGLYPLNAPVDVAIAAWPWGAYLGEDGHKNGIRVKVSPWQRLNAASLIPEAKATGQYLNSILAKVESAQAGYEEAILLNENGNVCEGTGENIFIVSDGRLITPPLSASILDGITRRSVIEIARDQGYEVLEQDVARAELYEADEVFFTGTAAEIVPIREIDDREVGPPGKVTLSIQEIYIDAVHGKLDRYTKWLDYVAAEPADDKVERISTAARS